MHGDHGHDGAKAPIKHGDTHGFSKAMDGVSAARKHQDTAALKAANDVLEAALTRSGQNIDDSDAFGGASDAAQGTDDAEHDATDSPGGASGL